MIDQKRISRWAEAIKIICNLFWGPSKENCDGLLSGKIQILADAFQGKEEIDFLAEQLSQFVQSHSQPDILQEALESVYVRLFINDRGGIQTPLYHSSYIAGNSTSIEPLMGDPLLEMQERFSEIGLAVMDTVNEPADHIALELEYLYYLLQQGIQTGDRGYLEGAASFCRDFMLPWINQLADRLNSPPDKVFYPGVTKMLMHLLEEIAGKALTL